MFLEISTSVRLDSLDEISIPHVAKMLVMPMPVKEASFGRTNDGDLKLEFVIEMYDNVCTSSVIFKEGSIDAVAALLDAIPYPIFLTGEMFMVAMTVGGFNVDLHGTHKPPFQVNFPNEALVGAN